MFYATPYVLVFRPVHDNMDFKIRRLRTTDYGWTWISSICSTGSSTCVVARKIKVKIGCYSTERLRIQAAILDFVFVAKMSFQNVRDSLVYNFADECIDEEEFVLLYDAYTSKNLIYPYWEYDDFDLDALDSSECLSDFRFNKEDIPRLSDALRIPQQFR